MGADDREDMVEITLGALKPKIPYQLGLEIAAHLRMACKHAARFDRAPATFWRHIDVDDLNDCPPVHRGFRRSRQVSNVNTWAVRVSPPLVSLVFNETATDSGYEDGIRLHHIIRRASRRAKAWAGDTSRYGRTLANVTDAEEDYRLGLG